MKKHLISEIRRRKEGRIPFQDVRARQEERNGEYLHVVIVMRFYRNMTNFSQESCYPVLQCVGSGSGQIRNDLQDPDPQL